MHTLFSARTVFVAALLVVALTMPAAAVQVVELDFTEPRAGDSGVDRVLNTITKVDDGLYLMTVDGDLEELYAAETKYQIAHSLILDRTRHCSVFKAAGGDAAMLGRNWDNENVGSIIVTLYRPLGGYASVSFSRAVELGFGIPIDLSAIESEALGERLLLAQYNSMDGMNERGFAVAVAGDKTTEVAEKDGAESIPIGFLMRKMLDACVTVDDAIALAGGYVPFLLDQNTNAGHMLVADATGASAILEYDDDQWLVTRGESAWQAMSTKRVFGVPDADQRENCWRYASMAGTLRAIGGVADWEATMAILEDVNQKGTTWSVAFDLTERELHFSVYQDWDTVYHVAMP